MAGLAVGALSCSSTGLQLPPSMNGDGVGGSSAGGSGVGGSGTGGSGTGGKGMGGSGAAGRGMGGIGGKIVEVADAGSRDAAGSDRGVTGAGGSGVGGSGMSGSGVVGSGMGGSAGGCGVSSTDAGATDGGGGPIVGSAIDLFDCSTEGFVFSTYDEPGNLARPTNPVVPPPTLSFDATQGSPFPGSVQVTAPFSGANQYVDIQKLVNVPAPLDWSGKSLHVRIKVSQGTFRGIVEPYVVTTGAYVFGGTIINIAPGSQWQEFVVDLTNPLTRAAASYNPAQVMLFGVQLNTGSAGAASTPVVFNVDSFDLTP